ncbi:MAG TPA: hypothetical protein VGO76_00805 [Luteibacter sp.]|nr:hypothetical protein [Luteibacter sp.]
MYDRSWMGFGMTGALQVGAIALVLGFVLFALLRLMSRKQAWGPGKAVALAFFFALLLSGSEDLWNLFYFNYAPVQSLQLLRLKLAAVHDPDAIGLRVLYEFLGSTVGVSLAWLVFGGGLRLGLDAIRRPRT